MKALLQLFLICGGLVGFLIFAPVGVYTWMLERAFGGDGESGMIYMPIGCVIALGVGLVWRRTTKKNEPPRSRRHLTEDGPGAIG